MGRKRLLEPVHDRKRFVDYSDGDTELSAPDARLVIANSEGYALWSKYESYVRLDPMVRDLIVAIREGEHDTVRSMSGQDTRGGESSLGCRLRAESGRG